MYPIIVTKINKLAAEFISNETIKQKTRFKSIDEINKYQLEEIEKEKDTRKHERFIDKNIFFLTTDLELFTFNLEKFYVFFKKLEKILNKESITIELLVKEEEIEITITKNKITGQSYLGSKLRKKFNIKDQGFKNKNSKIQKINENNQDLFIEYIKNINLYIKLIKSTIENEEISLENEKYFQKISSRLNHTAEIFEFFGIIKYKKFKENFLFPSLVSLKENWDELKESSNPLYTKKDFTLTNIKDLFIPYIKIISERIILPIDENIYALSSETKEKSNKVKIKTIAGILTINSETGYIVLNKTSFSLSPKSELFKILFKISEGNGNYESLGYGKKNLRNDLTQKIKELKHRLKILPRKNKINEDIFRNNKGHSYVIRIPE